MKMKMMLLTILLLIAGQAMAEIVNEYNGDPNGFYDANNWTDMQN